MTEVYRELEDLLMIHQMLGQVPRKYQARKRSEGKSVREVSVVIKSLEW